MKKLLAILALLLLPLTAFAQFTTTQGGTGTTSPSGILYGDGTLHLKTVSIGSGLSFITGVLSATGGGGGVGNWFTPTSYGNATSTTLGFLNGFTSPASSTVAGPFHLGLSNGGLGINAGLVYSGATTTFSGALAYLAGNVTCNTASGSVFGCLSSTDWTTFNNKQTAGSYITALTGDVTASGPGSAAATLATVNSNVGSFTNASITVNGKGLVTAASNGTSVAPGGVDSYIQFNSNSSFGGANSFIWDGSEINVGTSSVDGTIRAFMATMSYEAPIYYAANGNSFGTFNSGLVPALNTSGSICLSQSSGNLFSDPIIKAAFIAAQAVYGSVVTCFSDGTNWAAIVSLGTDGYGAVNSWCVSNSNPSQSVVTASALNGTGHVCTTVGSTAAPGILNLYATSSQNAQVGIQSGSSGFFTFLRSGATTATRILTLPNLAGVPALGSYISGYLSGQIPFGSSGVLATSSNFVFSSSKFGVGSSSPTSLSSIHANNGDTNLSLFSIGSSTLTATTTLFNVSNTGTTTIANGVSISAGCFFYNGACLTQALGTVTSVATDATLTGGPITTTGTLGLNLTNANTWTAKQTFNAFADTSGTTGGYKIDNNLILQASSTSGTLAIGQGAGGVTNANNTSATNNVFVGLNAGNKITTGASNILIGAASTVANDNLTSGSGNIKIGYNTSFPSATANYQLNIGNLLYGQNIDGAGLTYSTGQIGIGSTTPKAKFAIQANNGDSLASNWLFAIGSSTATATTTLFTVSNTGTTTIANGVNINAGCYSILGACLTAGAIGGGSTQAVNWATTAVLAGTPTYSNGTAGVGATLTEVGSGALSVDSNSPAAGDRVLVKNQASAFQNGIYVVTATGSGIASYILTRATDYNTPIEITPGINTYVLSGTSNTDTTWAVSFTPPLVIGTNNLTYAESSGGGTVTSVAASVPAFLSISGSPVTTSGTLAISYSGTALPVANGGTGATSLTANGFLVSNSAGTAVFTAASSTLNLPNSALANSTISGISLGNSLNALTATNGSLTFSGSYDGSTARTVGISAIAANSLLGNNTSASSVPAAVATSTLFGTPTPGTILAFLNGANTWTATTTYASPLSFLNGQVSCATCLTANQSITLTGAVTGSGATSITTSFGNLAQGWFGVVGSAAATPIANATTTLFSGSTGWNGYFSASGALVGTSSLFTSTAGYIGIGSTTPYSALSVGNGIASSSITNAEYAYGKSGNNATSTSATLSPQTSNNILWPIGASATTLTLCNFTPGQHMIVTVRNPAQTAGALTWAVCSGYQLEWPAKTLPTQTTTANDWDIWSFTASSAVGSTSPGTIMISGAQSANF